MTDKLILVALVLLIVEESVNLYSNRWVLQRNADICREGERIAREKAAYEKDRAERYKRAWVDVTGKTMSQALIITAEGVKSLPEGWEKHFESAWGRNGN